MNVSFYETIYNLELSAFSLLCTASTKYGVKILEYFSTYRLTVGLAKIKYISLNISAVYPNRDTV